VSAGGRAGAGAALLTCKLGQLRERLALRTCKCYESGGMQSLQTRGVHCKPAGTSELSHYSPGWPHSRLSHSRTHA
jgi:hypothetical protein